MRSMKYFGLSGLAGICVLQSACVDSTFSILPDKSVATQNGDSLSVLPINPGDPSAYLQQDSYLVSVEKQKVDLLFVVDNSGSMANKQAALASSFDDFITHFVDKKLDFHLGIVTTDTTAAQSRVNNQLVDYWDPMRPSSPYAGFIDPGQGRLLSKYSSERFLTSAMDSATLIDHFKGDVNVGTNGSGYEQAMKSLQLTLAPNMLDINSGFNAGFVRDDALLWVGVFSDEDESAPNDATKYQIALQLLARMQELKSANSKGFRYDFFINLDAPKPDPLPVYPQQSLPYPLLYLDAAVQLNHAATHNLKTDTAQDTDKFSALLDELGASLADEVEKQFPLKKHAFGAITVSIAGHLIIQDLANGYSLIAGVNGAPDILQLNGSALSSSAGKTILISYYTKDPK